MSGATNNTSLLRSGGAQAARPSSSASGSGSLFTGASNLAIHDGQFNNVQGNLVINLNQNSLPQSSIRNRITANNPSISSHRNTQTNTIREGPRVSQSFASGQIPVQQGNIIYQRHLELKGRGFPLWIPSANQNLPIQYRRTGIRIGDVGIITHDGGFSFLFNICLPHDDPANPTVLPDHFSPISPPIEPTDVDRFLVFRHGSHLASASVEKTQSDSQFPGFQFESSASEGAILTMPSGATSESLGNVARFRKYMTSNIVHWYKFVNGVLGREAKNGDIRLVIGCDKTIAWGIATFANNESRQNSCRLNFGPLEELSSNPISSDSCRYAWGYSGIADVRAGPSLGENDELKQIDDPGDIVYENQCLFLRTLNTTLGNAIWSEIDSDSGSIDLQPQSGFPPTQDPASKPSSTSRASATRNKSSSLSSHRLGNRRSLGPHSEFQNIDNKPVLDSSSPSALIGHPSSALNDILMAKVPAAHMVITQDEDWSCIASKYNTFPDPHELVEQILVSHCICEENGTIFLDRRSSIQTTSNSPELVVTSTDEIAPPLPSSSSFSDGITLTFKERSRPWLGLPNRKKTVPPAQTQALQNTQKRVAQAVASALGTVAYITHEALFTGVDLLDFAPIPGLRPAAHLLLDIWDISQILDMNRFSCLRLTERCADILISIRQEIFDAGDILGQELAAPIAKLEESFQAVHHFLCKQRSRPFLKRYLTRDQNLRDIAACDSSLRDALALFGISIQIRVLRQVQETEKHRQAETRALLEAIRTVHLPLSIPDSNPTIGDRALVSRNYQSETVTHCTTTENALGLFEDFPHLPSIEPQDLLPLQIIPVLASLHSLQNSLDTAMDTADLRQLIGAALRTANDAQMVQVLQIDHKEISDAIKTLQRALEHITERDGDGVEALPGKHVVVTRQVNLKEVREPGGPLKRSRTITNVDSVGSSLSGHSSEKRKDILDREFIESGISALRRLVRGPETLLPSWTITKYEVDRDKKIGIGFFSDVYKGTWQGQTVAIKVLAESTPRKLFIRKIELWKTLRHDNVLPLYGASSASGDPPWFFVSAYMENGSLVEYLKGVESEKRLRNLGIDVGSTHMPLSPIPLLETSLGSGMLSPSWTAARGISPTRRNLTPPGSRGRNPTPDDTAIHREWDLFRFMYEIAKGMEYLHSRGVLHGDLRGANVLVDDKYQCVISDFGQSEMKSEAYRISGTPPPHGTLRWQSPELMAGQSQLTQEIDVWAFSICCVEILTMGRLPWPIHDDDRVRHFVLKDDSRPPLPDHSRFNTQGLQDILRVCWATNPIQRPTFSKLVKDFKQLRKSSGQEVVDSPRVPVIEEVPEITSSPSPDMRPTSLLLPLLSTPYILPGLGDIYSTSVFPPSDNIGTTENMKIPEPVSYTPPSSQSSPVESPSEEYLNVVDFDGYDSPPPVDGRTANILNERRYRLLLTHDYHPSLTLPLWNPSPVEVGAVGYLLKSRGQFVTLFNALTPGKADHAEIRSLPSIHKYGLAQLDTHRQDRRTVTQKGMDAIGGLLTFGTFSEKVSRSYSYPLKAGHKMACLCTETTDHRYLETLDASKKWFQTHADFIMQTFKEQYHIQKEDLFLVTGTLSAPDHALFVSHSHPEGHAHFSVYATPKNGRPWGMFTIERGRALGPPYDEPSDIVPVQSSKVSNHGGAWNTVLLARLRFKPDILEPTYK